MTVRLRHVAEHTGLSQATISKVLNGHRGVSEDTQKKVREAIESLGFKRWPKLYTDSPALLNVTVITYSLSAYRGAFYDKILRSIVQEGQKHGVTVEANLLMLPPSEPDVPKSMLFQKGIPNAAILLGVDHPAVLDKLAATGCTCLLAVGIDPLMRFDSVCPDHFLGGFLATQHLIDLGHRDIVHIGTSRRMTLDLRRQGFITAITQAGITYSPERHYIDLGLQEFSVLDEAWLSEQMVNKSRPKGTAFFAVADAVALSAIQILNQHHLSVPKQVSVIGFDDLSVSALCHPPLTTLSSEGEIIGKIAMRRLIERFADPALEALRISVGINFILRESTAPPSMVA